MTPFRSQLGSLILLGVLAISAGDLRAQGECKRSPARPVVQGEVITLKETAKFPCRIEFVASATALRGDADPSISDLGQYVARGPDGRFYTPSRSGEIYVWSPTGQFVRSFGKNGGGPGEFVGGAAAIQFGRDGTLLIGDRTRWSMFSPALEFQRTVGASATGGGRGTTFLTTDGQLVSATAQVARAGNAFALFDLSANADGQPRLVRAFGTASPQALRQIAPSSAMNFWAAPFDGKGGGYTLELWRTDGTHLRTINRDVPWFVTDPGGKVPPPEMEIVHDDGTGIAFVSLMAPNVAKWKAAGEQPDRATMNAMIDIYFEAIDGASGTVFASWGPFHPDEAMKSLPAGFFPRTRTGYRREQNADGFTVMRIVDLKLVSQ